MAQIMLVTVIVNYEPYLISRVGLKEGIQLVHLSDVSPQVDQLSRDLKVAEEGS